MRDAAKRLHGRTCRTGVRFGLGDRQVDFGLAVRGFLSVQLAFGIDQFGREIEDCQVFLGNMAENRHDIDAIGTLGPDAPSECVAYLVVAPPLLAGLSVGQLRDEIAELLAHILDRNARVRIRELAAIVDEDSRHAMPPPRSTEERQLTAAPLFRRFDGVGRGRWSDIPFSTLRRSLFRNRLFASVRRSRRVSWAASGCPT
jgi:hypothetical protein